MKRSSRIGLIVGFAMTCTAAVFAAAPTVLTEPIDTNPTWSITSETTAPATTPAAPSDVPSTPPRSATAKMRSGNPLWAIPLKNLSITRERPIFSQSRRPPPPAVAAAPYVPPPPPPTAAEPERPLLRLVGTVAGGRDSFGIFVDQSTNDVVRIKLGDAQRGWQLRQVLKREVTLQKDQETVVLALPIPSDRPTPAGGEPADPPTATTRDPQ
jgi:hypothetical protein